MSGHLLPDPMAATHVDDVLTDAEDEALPAIERFLLGLEKKPKWARFLGAWVPQAVGEGWGRWPIGTEAGNPPTAECYVWKLRDNWHRYSVMPGQPRRVGPYASREAAMVAADKEAREELGWLFIPALPSEEAPSPTKEDSAPQPEGALCGNEYPDLAPCTLARGHEGPHSNGAYNWGRGDLVPQTPPSWQRERQPWTPPPDNRARNPGRRRGHHAWQVSGPRGEGLRQCSGCGLWCWGGPIVQAGRSYLRAETREEALRELQRGNGSRSPRTCRVPARENSEEGT